MSFILKKIIASFLMPLPIAILLGSAAFIFLYKNKLKKAKGLLLFSFVWIFIWTYAPVVNTLLRKLETNYPSLTHVAKEIQYIYILGSGHRTDKTLPITSQLDRTAVVRLNEGIRLYHLCNKDAKLILSGYSGLHDTTPHALMEKKLALSLGMSPQDLIVRTTPKDTKEEALAAKNIVGKDPFILVTSASHMTRAMKLFEKEGLHPVAAPTDHQVKSKKNIYSEMLNATNLRKSEILFHEILGLLWSKLKGDI